MGSKTSLLLLMSVTVLLLNLLKHMAVETIGNANPVVFDWVYLYLIASLIDYRRYARTSFIFRLFFGLLGFGGPMIYGARRRIDFGIFKVQPSELAKWATRFLDPVYCNTGGRYARLQREFKGRCCFALPTFLIFLSPI